MKIHIHGQADRFNGWGLHTYQAVTHLGRRATVTFSHKTKDSLAGDDPLPYGHQDSPDVTLQILPVDSHVDYGSIVWTMHESTRIPQHCVDQLNKAKAVLVPTVWNAEGFKNSGVTRPIYIARLGYDHTQFHFKPKRSGPLVFGTGGSISGAGERKEVQRVVDAFYSMDIDATLKVKVFPWDQVDSHGDPRIQVTKVVWPELTHVEEWYHGLDCFVTASRGEGFGLMPLQSLVCGVDVIAPIYSGHRAYMTPDIVHPLDYRIVNASGHYVTGLQCQVETDSLALAMLNVARIRSSESERNRVARTKANHLQVAHLTWESSMVHVFNLIHEIDEP